MILNLPTASRYCRLQAICEVLAYQSHSDIHDCLLSQMAVMAVKSAGLGLGDEADPDVSCALRYDLCSVLGMSVNNCCSHARLPNPRSERTCALSKI